MFILSFISTPLSLPQFTMSEKLCLQWNDFKDNVIASFGNLREDNDFTDVTLACEDGKQVEAHKVILSSSSPFFQNILKRNQHTHPLIYMRGVKFEDISAIIDFLYFGETNVYQENLDSFLAIAQELQLKGLMGKADKEVEMQKETSSKTPVPTKANKVPKTEASSFKSVSSSSPSALVEPMFGQELDRGCGTVALANNLSRDLGELVEQVNSMMEKTPRKTVKGKPVYNCNVCGKEAESGDLKKHIEAKHLEGVSIPCNFCEKTFRSRNSLTTHNNRYHNVLT